jgi:hypothetical protein
VHSDTARRLLLIPCLLLTILITSPTNSLIIYTCYLLSFTSPPGPRDRHLCLCRTRPPHSYFLPHAPIGQPVVLVVHAVHIRGLLLRLPLAIFTHTLVIVTAVFIAILLLSLLCA